MKYVKPYDAVDDNSPYVNGNPSVGIEGSIPDAMAFEAPLRELHRVVEDSTIVPSNTDLYQLIKALRIARYSYYIAAGSANGLIISSRSNTALAALVAGLPLNVMPTLRNTGVTTVAIDGLAAAPLRRRGGGELVSGDILAGVPFGMIYTGSEFRLLTFGMAEVPVNSDGSPIIWVRTDGNDNNDGTDNLNTKAFLTVMAAIRAGISRYNLSGKVLDVRLGNEGIYTGEIWIDNMPPIKISQTQDSSRYAFYILSNANNCLTIGGTSVTIQNITVSNPGTTDFTADVSYAGSLTCVGNVRITGTAGPPGPPAIVVASNRGQFSSRNLLEIGGNGLMGFFISAGDVNLAIGSTLSYIGSPIFGTSNIVAQDTGTMIAPNGAITVIGAATGPRYQVTRNAVINTNGGGANFFPGTVAGSAGNGGIYV